MPTELKIARFRVLVSLVGSSVLFFTISARGAAPPQAGAVLPAVFHADRVYVTCKIRPTAPTLSFYTDTGGSLVITTQAASKVHLKVVPSTDPDLIHALGADARTASAPEFEDCPQLPAQSQFVVVKKMSQIPGWPNQGDGILGQAWLGGHVWTWDYPGEKLILRPEGWTPAASAHSLPVAFKMNSSGERETNFPRVSIRVNGQEIPVLFDTGAETFLTPRAMKVLNDGGPRLRATTMIMHSVFERWHTEHPDWRIIDEAQVTTHSRMMQVPNVEIAGFDSGPIWITERPDANFLNYMSAMMSASVEGSAGGNIFHGLRITLDYNRSKMWIENNRRR